MLIRISPLLLLLALSWTDTVRGQTSSTSVAISPDGLKLVRVNSDQDSISVVDLASHTMVDLDPGIGVSRSVGEDPRTLAFLPNGSRLYVANMRGEGEPFPNQLYGTITVLNPNSGYSIVTEIGGVGIEPYGIAVAPDGGYVAVTGHQSHTVTFLDPATNQVTFQFVYNADVEHPFAIANQLDSELDGRPDLAHPRGILISPSGDSVYVTHFYSGRVSKLSVAQSGPGGPVTGAQLATVIDLNRYQAPVDSNDKPLLVTTNASQGFATHLESIALEPGEQRAWVPHVLSNQFVLVEEERFSVDNQLYPAVSIIDLDTDSFEYGLPTQIDTSDRIEWRPLPPVGQARNLGTGSTGSGGHTPTLDIRSDPKPGGAVELSLRGGLGGTPGILLVGTGQTSIPTLDAHLYVSPIVAVVNLTLGGQVGVAGSGGFTVGGSLPTDISTIGTMITCQAIFADPAAPYGITFSNAVMIEIGGVQPPPPSSFGPRIAQPVQVAFSSSKNHAFVLGGASEDITVFEFTPAGPSFRGIYPPPERLRIPFDTQFSLGESPTGLAVAPAGTGEEFLHVANATSQDEQTLRFKHQNASLLATKPRLATITNDTFSIAERRGLEMFSDATRTQTASNGNGSCVTCHTDGSSDLLTWHFANGPRQTPSLRGGPETFGLLFWKSNNHHMRAFAEGFRQHHGGNGQFTDEDFDGLAKWMENHLPLPINPAREITPSTSLLRGRDLYFGLNDTGTNPTLRSANCAMCHPQGTFTIDDLTFPTDPCTSMQQNFANMKVVGTSDQDGLFTDDGDFIFTVPGCEQLDSNGQPTGQPKTYFRSRFEFSVPTKLGAFATPPYFHTGNSLSLRSTIDPSSQSQPDLSQLLNTVHDIRGFVVLITLQTPPSQQDIEDLLTFIRSL